MGGFFLLVLGGAATTIFPVFLVTHRVFQGELRHFRPLAGDDCWGDNGPMQDDQAPRSVDHRTAIEPLLPMPIRTPRVDWRAASAPGPGSSLPGKPRRITSTDSLPKWYGWSIRSMANPSTNENRAYLRQRQGRSRAGGRWLFRHRAGRSILHHGTRDASVSRSSSRDIRQQDPAFDVELASAFFAYRPVH